MYIILKSYRFCRFEDAYWGYTRKLKLIDLIHIMQFYWYRLSDYYNKYVTLKGYVTDFALIGGH